VFQFWWKPGGAWSPALARNHVGPDQPRAASGRPEDQLSDVLDRFAPPLAPWTRCPACNGLLGPASKADVEPELQPGTRRRYQAYSRCRDCGRVYWRGAHSQRLQRVVDSALAAVAASRDA
jgi:uncharacterized protein with PIN domain